MKNLVNFEKLVDYATSGAMSFAEKEATVIKLKAEKKAICKQLSAMQNSEERRNAYKELNRLMYQLYNAKAFVRMVKDEETKKLIPMYIKADSMANMILCYSM